MDDGTKGERQRMGGPFCLATATTTWEMRRTVKGTKGVDACPLSWQRRARVDRRHHPHTGPGKRFRRPRHAPRISKKRPAQPQPHHFAKLNRFAPRPPTTTASSSTRLALCRDQRLSKMAGLSPQITNLIIILGMMQVSKRIPFDDPTVLMGVRGVYIASNVLIALVYLYIQTQVNKKKDMTTLKYVEPPPMGSTEESKLVTTTVHAYDLQQLRTAFRGQLMGVAMMAFMHIYMKYTNPLLIQSIIPVKSALESNLVKIYLYGQPAVGDLKRPFKQPQGFMSAMQGGQVQSDKKAVEAAEKMGRGGAKEE
ncbi:Inorganic phosphate transport protein PHO88 [Tolypocladium ophioglossoides CBS 100239]|uniref:Inorganic phosphate transport protein PHO88 n=1 Tax=Tolypocladium ophioglossoides (strain CBS 100239) TaxID=1163406 RepID=A0A0L0N114_TOLOC|nr:Inorganic phosphate transport protein PHO88 [Tolypocladium ophioglossoides CBS 100239]